MNLYVIFQELDGKKNLYGPFNSEKEAIEWANLNHGFDGFSSYDSYDVVKLKK